MRNVVTITHATFSLKPFILQITTKTVQSQSILAGKYHITRNKTLVLYFRHSFKSGFKIIPRQISLFSVINQLIANDFYRFSFLSIDFFGIQLHPELHRGYFQKEGDLNPENLGKQKISRVETEPTNLANTSHQKKVLNLVFKERILRFLKYLFKSDKCLINNTVINV